MLTKETAPLLPSSLTVVGQGLTVKFDITYHNRKQTEVEEHLRTPGLDLADHVIFLISDWQSAYPLTKEGIIEMENDRPGMCSAIIQGFHKARLVALEKN